jgi:hypothetical protein
MHTTFGVTDNNKDINKNNLATVYFLYLLKVSFRVKA